MPPKVPYFNQHAIAMRICYPADESTRTDHAVTHPRIEPRVFWREYQGVPSSRTAETASHPRKFSLVTRIRKEQAGSVVEG